MFAPRDDVARIGDLPVRLVRSPRARRLRLRVDGRTRDVWLTLPPSISRRRALAWAEGHRQWIEERLASIPQRLALVPGAALMLRGEPHRIEWNASASRHLEVAEGIIAVGGPIEGMEARIVRGLRARALELLTRETREMAAAGGLKLVRVGIGDPRSRWGSCSSAGSIRYSWRLLLAPDFVRRATVAHEVAHLRHLDHQPAFHALVRQLLGEDPAPARAWLRRHGTELHRIGPA